MNRKQWLAIDNARKTLKLGDKATRTEIRRAYHSLCKKYHPDTADKQSKKDQEMIYRLTRAYELLMEYCDGYEFPLKPEENSIYDAEDWWLDRFGNDPLWGRSKKR